MQGNGLTAASIVAVRRHPNADKLKVCVVDTGSGTVEVRHTQSLRLAIFCAERATWCVGGYVRVALIQLGVFR
jgi:hypothetical protein